MVRLDKGYVYKPLIDSSAPIIPGKEIGGLSLNTNLSEIKDWIMYNFFIKNVDELQVTAFNGIYLLYNYKKILEFVVDATQSRIVRISCMKGYTGRYNSVKPGDKFYELLKIDRDFYINNSVILSKKNQGIEIDLPDEFEDIDYIEQLPDFEITKISVFS